MITKKPFHPPMGRKGTTTFRGSTHIPRSCKNALVRPVTGPGRTHYWLCAGWRGVSPSRADGALSAGGAPLCLPPGKRDISRVIAVYAVGTIKQRGPINRRWARSIGPLRDFDHCGLQFFATSSDAIGNALDEGR